MNFEVWDFFTNILEGLVISVKQLYRASRFSMLRKYDLTGIWRVCG